MLDEAELTVIEKRMNGSYDGYTIDEARDDALALLGDNRDLRLRIESMSEAAGIASDHAEGQDATIKDLVGQRDKALEMLKNEGIEYRHLEECYKELRGEKEAAQKALAEMSELARASKRHFEAAVKRLAADTATNLDDSDDARKWLAARTSKLQVEIMLESNAAETAAQKCNCGFPHTDEQGLTR